MFARTRKHALTIAVAAVTAAVTAGAPAIADGVAHAMFAHNADKVDDKHAVGAGATIDERKGKLVATNATGRLPNDIIATAPNADRLDGASSNAFARRNDVATLAGFSEVASFTVDAQAPPPETVSSISVTTPRASCPSGQVPVFDYVVDATGQIEGPETWELSLSADTTALQDDNSYRAGPRGTDFLRQGWSTRARYTLFTGNHTFRLIGGISGEFSSQEHYEFVDTTMAAWYVGFGCATEV